MCKNTIRKDNIIYPLMFELPKLNFEIEDTYLNTDLFKEHIKPNKGTTTLAFIFKHGMVIAVDSRATSGNYIASQTVKKVIEVNKFLLGTMAGGAADCQYWEGIMGIEAKRYELENGRRITASAASMYLSNCVNRYKDRGLSMGTMVCGWDVSGPGLYYVDDKGGRLPGEMFSVGSGSTIAYGILEKGYRYEMEREEALELGRKAIFYAGHRDAFSGGTVKVYFMDHNGWTKTGDYDFKDLFDEYNKKY